MRGKIVLIVEQVDDVCGVPALYLLDISSEALHGSLQDCEQHLFNLGNLGVIWVFKHVEAGGDKYAHEIFLYFLLIPQILNVLLENILEMLERLNLKHLDLIQNLSRIG